MLKIGSGARYDVHSGPSDPASHFYFFLPDARFGCHPAAAPFWLGAAAIVLIFSFFGFFFSRFASLFASGHVNLLWLMNRLSQPLQRLCPNARNGPEQ